MSEMICPLAENCYGRCFHNSPHTDSDECLDKKSDNNVCPACIPYVPEVPSVLLTDEEQGNIMANCENPDCEFKVKTTCLPCPDMLKAQHIKSVKAVFAELKKHFIHDSEHRYHYLLPVEQIEALKKKMLEG